jgi:hypothetical protein
MTKDMGAYSNRDFWRKCDSFDAPFDIGDGFRHLTLVTLGALPQKDGSRCDRRRHDMRGFVRRNSWDAFVVGLVALIGGPFDDVPAFGLRPSKCISQEVMAVGQMPSGLN